MDAGARTRLAHQCSGKHALMLWAHTVLGGAPDTYLDPASPLSERIRQVVRTWSAEEPGDLGVDGCGAPVWTLSVVGLARMVGRFAASEDAAEQRVARAMRARPDLVGGAASHDTRLMLAVPGIVAKRGAEGVLIAGTPEGLGVAVKVSDGAARAALPVAASVLRGLGLPVPEDLCVGAVLGGGRRQGAVEVVAELTGLAG